MFYEVHCLDCEEQDIIIAPIAKGPGAPKCPKCGGKMQQDYSSNTRSIRIPEHMRAGSDAVSPTAIGNKMNRSRPSGKRRSLHSVGGI